MVCTQLKVKEFLKKKGWTTKVLAEKTGMSESYLTHIKNATRRWNEDALRRIAEAFEVDPVNLFSDVESPLAAVGGIDQKNVDKKLSCANNITYVPAMSEFPSFPSPYNNQISQVRSGFKDVFVPVMGINNENAFCLMVENQLMAPRFVKGDYLIISPSDKVESGDMAAVEYLFEGKTVKKIAIVSFTEDLIVIESVNYKTPTIALRKTRDSFRIIGRVMSFCQQYI